MHFGMTFLTSIVPVHKSLKNKTGGGRKKEGGKKEKKQKKNKSQIQSSKAAHKLPHSPQNPGNSSVSPPGF